MNKSMTNSMKNKWENGSVKAFDVCHQLCNKIIGHTTNKTAIKYLEQRLNANKNFNKEIAAAKGQLKKSSTSTHTTAFEDLIEIPNYKSSKNLQSV